MSSLNLFISTPVAHTMNTMQYAEESHLLTLYVKSTTLMIPELWTFGGEPDFFFFFSRSFRKYAENESVWAAAQSQQAENAWGNGAVLSLLSDTSSIYKGFISVVVAPLVFRSI